MLIDALWCSWQQPCASLPPPAQALLCPRGFPMAALLADHHSVVAAVQAAHAPTWRALLLATLVTTYMNCSTRPLVHASSGTAKVFCTSASLNTFNSQSLVSSLVSLVIRAMCTASSWSLDNNGGSLQNSSSEHFTVVCSVKRTPPAPPASMLDLAWHHKPTRYCVPSPALRGERAEEACQGTPTNPEPPPQPGFRLASRPPVGVRLPGL